MRRCCRNSNAQFCACVRHRGLAILAATVLTVAAVGTADCHADSAAGRRRSSGQLRVGISVSQVSVVEVERLLSLEALARVSDDGRPSPWLADHWITQDGGRTLLITLQRGAIFHDGTAVDGNTVVPLVRNTLSAFLGRDSTDVEEVKPGAADPLSVAITFRHPSPLWLEALELSISKPGTHPVGTGPFVVQAEDSHRLVANEHYYSGPPHIGSVSLQEFPSVRNAWADLLRGRIDMLWEVGPDALDSLEGSSNISVSKFTRPYQYTLVLNTAVPALRSASIRRALNAAIDRSELVRRALNQHGVPSSGPVWPHYWALPRDAAAATYEPKQAANVLQGKRVHFVCLVPQDVVFERLALELKRQFSAVDVDMSVETATVQRIAEVQRTGSYEAVLVDRLSGPTMFRLQLAWRSPSSPGLLRNSTIDAAFDRVRNAATEAAYRDAVGGLQFAFNDDPPAIFLAWGERARAISNRYLVPTPERGRDVLATMRFWAPRNDSASSRRN